MTISLRLLALICIFAGAADNARAGNSSDDALSAQVDEIVRTQMREQRIPGVSLAVMRDGRIIKATRYGLANVELTVPVTPQMVFNADSLAKAFTATAVMMLVEEGKVGLDDKISKYLPEAPLAWSDTIIRRLLTHTSGLRDYFGEDGDPKYDFHTDFTEDELVRKFAAQSMRFPAGEQWRYNTGYVILGVVIHATITLRPRMRSTAKHLPQRRTDTGCAPDKPGHSSDALCTPAVCAPKTQEMLSSPQIFSSGPICFSHFFDSWKQHRSEREISQGRILCAA